ncbi:NYN domain-containing protein [bacterium]|nr:NYN domain-containing protein [bacterium]RQV92058.1 MAG: NYN domain-containing protein [bacterium]
MEKVIVYIDGFNLYFGLKEKKWKRYYWLNLQKLAKALLKEDQKLIMTKYFTSRVSFPPDKVKRQTTFIEALETLKKFKIYYGHYLPNDIECYKCGNIIPKPNEKMTDVNIAVEMLTDAFKDRFDRAILISADSDLSAPIKKVKKLFPEKRIANSVFPDRLKKLDGFILRRPDEWK